MDKLPTSDFRRAYLSNYPKRSTTKNNVRAPHSVGHQRNCFAVSLNLVPGQVSTNSDRQSSLEALIWVPFEFGKGIVFAVIAIESYHEHVAQSFHFGASDYSAT